MRPRHHDSPDPAPNAMIRSLHRMLHDVTDRNGSRRRTDVDDPRLLDDLPPLLMTTTAWLLMMTDLTSRPVEAGGVLIGPSGHDAVTHYVPDLTGHATGASFTFDHERINQTLRQYVPLGLDAKGIAHSHPSGCLTPSLGDLDFVFDCFATVSADDVERFYLPIVVGRRLFPYTVFRGNPLVTVCSQLILF